MHRDQIALREECDKVLSAFKKTVEKVRNISHALSPSILNDLGLRAAHQMLVNNFATFNQLEVSMDLPDTINKFSAEQQIVIYRIFQEVLTNIGKHAQADKIHVECKSRAGTVFFRVADNGKGFDYKQIQARSLPDRGFGLAAMNERLNMLGGHFTISSQKHKGTEIAFEIPIDQTT
jgi:two-component system NarL family sensor kinase